ncbi:MAG: hypothetical protein KF817_08755 [Phycisphaeraceae bacterium]|nr:hypothetical protein [Phycisphaeraceae bacterium]
MLRLACGALLTVAVSWGCAVREIGRARALHAGRSFDVAGVAEWNVNTVVGLGSTHVLSQAFGSRISDPAEESPCVMSAPDALPWWSPWLHPDTPLGEAGWMSRSALAHGLPVRAMVVVHDEVNTAHARGARPWRVHGIPPWVRGRTGRGAWPTGPVELPLQPIWAGLACNTLFYALLLWLVSIALFTARRVRRRRRGLCEQCAYPVGAGPDCTECGAAVPRMSRAR